MSEETTEATLQLCCEACTCTNSHSAYPQDEDGNWITVPPTPTE